MQRFRMLAIPALLALLLGACTSGDTGTKVAGGVGETATSFLHVHGLAVDTKGILFVATHGGLIKQAAENRWVYASPDRNDYMGFSMDPKTGTMWRSGHSPSKPSLGVEMSTNAGRSWRHLSDVLSPAVDFHAMTVSFADGKTLWGWDSGGRGRFRSTDGGTSWRRLPKNEFTYVLSGPMEAGIVYAGVLDGMVRSTDAGLTWQPVGALSGGWVIAIATNPADTKNIIAFTQRGMKISADGGTTWRSAISGVPAGAEITALAFSPMDTKTIFAAAATTIFRSKDGGLSWNVIRQGP